MTFIHVNYGDCYGSPTARFLRGARVPAHVGPALGETQEVGSLRYLFRQEITGIYDHLAVGGHTLMVLCEWTDATLHLPHGYTVMEDSRRELQRHLPIWLAARGRILVSGLGLGCVVRGLLLKDEVEHIDVLEIDAEIIAAIGPEFAGNPRVTIHHIDALEFPINGRRWDYAWHDVSTPDDRGLQALHGKLIRRYWPHVGLQGAWDFPREVSRRLPYRLLGTPKTPRNRAWRRPV